MTHPVRFDISLHDMMQRHEVLPPCAEVEHYRIFKGESL